MPVAVHTSTGRGLSAAERREAVSDYLASRARAGYVSARPGAVRGVMVNRPRAEWYFRAEYFAWCGRRALAGCDEAGRDPLTGRPFSNELARRRLGVAAARAQAVECYRIARRFASPLP